MDKPGVETWLSVEHLPSMCQVLDLNYSARKKRERERKRREERREKKEKQGRKQER